jgi:hypothetical protein
MNINQVLGREQISQEIKKILDNFDDNCKKLDFKKGILEFITYIELDTQEYNSIDVALDAQVQLANNYSNLMIKIGNFIIPNDK